MCKIIVLNRTKSGIILYCNNNKNYQLLFKNLNFNLTVAEWKSFYNYIHTVDIHYWEKEYRNSIYKKTIPIPTVQSNFIILLDKHELMELKDLMNFSTQDEIWLSLDTIDYPLNLN